VRTIKKSTVSLIISGVLVLGITLNAQAFDPAITTVNTANNVDIVLITEQSHASRNFINYLNIGSKNLKIGRAHV
jgi:conjugal transfer/entry exclusion protein